MHHTFILNFRVTGMCLFILAECEFICLSIVLVFELTDYSNEQHVMYFIFLFHTIYKWCYSCTCIHV